MKKVIILGSALCVLASYSANADISVGINLGEPVYEAPVYAVAPDYPSYHYDHHRHSHNDYWAHRQQHEHARANENRDHRS